MLNKLEEMLVKSMEEAQEIGVQITTLAISKKRSKELRVLLRKNERVIGKLHTLEDVIQLYNPNFSLVRFTYERNKEVLNTIAGEC